VGFNDNEEFECWSNEVDADAENKRALAAEEDRKYLEKVNKGKPKHKHRKATKPSIVSKGHCHATVADHNLDSEPENRIDVSNCYVCICEAPNYFDHLKANENVERDFETENVDEVEANVEDVQVELDRLVEIDVEATSSKQTIAEVESIKNILEKDVQSGFLKIGNSFIDAVIDQELATTSNQDKSVQPKLGKHAKKRLRAKENNGIPAKKINSLF